MPKTARSLRAGASREDTGSTAGPLGVSDKDMQAWGSLSCRSTTVGSLRSSHSFASASSTGAPSSSLNHSASSTTVATVSTRLSSTPGVQAENISGCSMTVATSSGSDDVGRQWLVEVKPLPESGSATHTAPSPVAQAKKGVSSPHFPGQASVPVITSVSAAPGVPPKQEEVRDILWELEVERLRCATLKLEVQRQIEESNGLWRQLRETETEVQVQTHVANRRRAASPVTLVPPLALQTVPTAGATTTAVAMQAVPQVQAIPACGIAIPPVASVPTATPISASFVSASTPRLSQPTAAAAAAVQAATASGPASRAPSVQSSPARRRQQPPNSPRHNPVRLGAADSGKSVPGASSARRPRGPLSPRGASGGQTEGQGQRLERLGSRASV